MIAQSRGNAVTQDAICTWVERLRPSDHAAIAGEHMRCNPHAHPRCARRRRCLFLARRPRRAAGSSGQLLLRRVCAPVGRGEPGAAGGLRAALVPGACARASAPGRRVVLRRRGPRIGRQRSRPSLGTGDTSAMAAAKRKPAAKKPAAKKPAVKKCGAASNMRRDRASPVPAGRPRRSRPPRRAPRSSMRRPDAISMLFP